MLKADWKSEPRYYGIPGGLCFIAIREKIFREIQVYMAFKAICRGQLRINGEIVSKVGKMLGVSSKTVSRALSFLLQRDWIGYNPNSGIHHVRGIDEVRRIEKIIKKSAYRLDVIKIKSIKAFRAFLIGGAITELINSQRDKLIQETRRRLAEDQIRLRAYHKADLSSFYPISCKALSKIFQISEKSASNYRKEADSQGFIKLREDISKALWKIRVGGKLKEVEITPNDLQLVRRNSNSNSRAFKKYFIKDNKVWIRKPTQAKSKLIRQKRRNNPKIYFYINPKKSVVV